MIRAVIIQYVTDDTFEYRIGDRVRIKLHPKDPYKPELASEYIGPVDDIRKNKIALNIHGATIYFDLNDIDKMRWVEPDETFENTWEF